MPTSENRQLRWNSHDQEESLGLIETKGFIALMAAGDAMLKTANVELIGINEIGGAFATIAVHGDVGSVRAAVEAGAQAAQQNGELVSSHVIPRPEKALGKLFAT